MKKSFWIIIVLVAFVAIFSVQNAGNVNVKFLGFDGMISLALLLIVTFILGTISGVAYAMISKKSKNKKKSIEQVTDNEEINNTSIN